MKSLSIRWRLTLWYAAALVVLLSIFSAALILLTRQQLLSRTDGALREELRELSLEMQLTPDATGFAAHLQTRFTQHDIYDFAVFDESGIVHFRSQALLDVPSAQLPDIAVVRRHPFMNLELGIGTPFRVYCQPVKTSRGDFWAMACTSLKPFLNEMWTLQMLVLALLPVGVVIALVGGYFLAKRALAPVDHIAQVASDITISDLDRRIPVTNSQDEIGKLTLTLNSLIARLEQAVDEIRRFTADASHELRTPLAALRCEAESALQRLRSPEEYEQTLRSIVDEADRLTRLTSQLLDLSRLDTGLAAGVSEPVRLDAIVQDVVDQLRPLADDRQIQLSVADLTPCEAQGNDIQLRQAILNVVENALKYSHQGGDVQVVLLTGVGTAQIVVKDTGVGIREEHLARVFDRFYRVDASRHASTGGAGLGLSIARSTLRAHGGDIQLKSRFGVGTTAILEIPGTVVNSAENSPVRSASPVSA